MTPEEFVTELEQAIASCIAGYGEVGGLAARIKHDDRGGLLGYLKRVWTEIKLCLAVTSLNADLEALLSLTERLFQEGIHKKLTESQRDRMRSRYEDILEQSRKGEFSMSPTQLTARALYAGSIRMRELARAIGDSVADQARKELRRGLRQPESQQ